MMNVVIDKEKIVSILCVLDMFYEPFAETNQIKMSSHDLLILVIAFVRGESLCDNWYWRF